MKGAFEVVVLEPLVEGARQRSKKYGQVSDMRFTEKGKVENKPEQVLMMLGTTAQEEDSAPLALQMAKLNYSGLRADLLKECKKGLPAKHSLIQLAGIK